MSFVRYGLPALIAALALLLIATPAQRTAHADGHGFGGIGVVLLINGAALSDALVYVINGVTVPREGEAYEGWLVNSATGERASTGIMAVSEDGQIVHRYLTPDGASILELGYDTVEITREPAPDDDPGPGETLYSYTHPELLLVHTRHLLSHGVLPEHAIAHGHGDPEARGDLEVLYDDLGEAIELANAAMEAETFNVFYATAQALLAVDDRLLLEEALIHTELITGVHNVSLDVIAGQTDGNIATAEGWTLRARALTEAALATNSLEAGKAALDGAADALNSARGAVIGAYGWAQLLATFHVPTVPDIDFDGVLPFAELNAAIRKELSTADAPFGGYGRAYVRSIAANSDGLVYALNGVAVPREGEAYEGWLVNSATGERLSTGVMEVEMGGIRYLYRMPGGENIIELGYDTVEITREPVPDDDPGPGERVYAYTQPGKLIDEVRHLISHGLPLERAGERGPGDPDLPGDFEILARDLVKALGLVDAAMAAETLDGFRAAVRSLLEVDAQLLLDEAAIHVELLTGVHGPRVDLEVVVMELYTDNAEARSLRVRDLARAALAAESLEAGKAALGGAASELRVSLTSVDRAVQWAQSLASFHAPAPPGYAPPSGDAMTDGDAMTAPTPPSSGNAGLASAGGASGWQWAALIAAIGATAAVAAFARRDAGRRRAA